METPTSLAKYMNQYFYQKFEYHIIMELDKNQNFIHSSETKLYRRIEGDIQKVLKKWIEEKSSFYIIDCPMEKEIIFILMENTINKK